MKKDNYILFSIILLGFFLRIFNLNWDLGYLFHPDERAIIMAVDGLEYPASFTEFLSPASPFNPNFFAYGNFPMYLLKIFSDLLSLINPVLAQYGGMHLVGRLINVLIDTGTIILIYLIATKMFDKRIALLSAFFYSIAVFPIQNSHFFTVDIPLTFFTILTLLFLQNYIEKTELKYSILTGISFGLALATKISILPLAFVLVFGFLISHFKKSKSFSLKKIANQAINIILLFTASIFTFFTTQPYVLIDFNNFYEQVKLQANMGSDPFVFPYTLQYVGKIPIFYEIKNIAFWGLGIPISIFTLLGIIYLTVISIRKYKSSKAILLCIFFWLYFLLVSSYAVGWMRYLLPIYPILTIAASVFSIKILFPFFIKKLKLNKKPNLSKAILITFLILNSIWTFSFMNIYTQKNTKVVASEWIHENINQGKTLAVEHWDDILPVYGGENYNYQTLALYDPDTKEKWITINNQVAESDYIIIASNRLYDPLSKLTNCNILPENRCYPLTAEYYRDLFSGKLGFKKIPEFSSYPTIPILNIKINDQSADESFTVYDHPKIMIFKKY